jgi:hypothetical protein
MPAHTKATIKETVENNVLYKFCAQATYSGLAPANGQQVKQNHKMQVFMILGKGKHKTENLYSLTAVKCITVPVTRQNVRFEVFRVVTMKNAVFWDVMPCGSCKNRPFGGAKFLQNVGSYKSHTA